MAFIIGGIVFVCTIVLSGLMLFAAGMSDSPSAAADVRVMPVFIGGMIITALIVASHWLPHIGW